MPGEIVQVALGCPKLLLILVDQEIIDAQGLTLLPGVIDLQAHFFTGLVHQED